MFVTINHPSEVNEKRCQSQIRSFTAKEREKKKRLRAANNYSQATAKSPDHRIVSPIAVPHYKPPSPIASNASSLRDLAIPPTLRFKLCTNAIDTTRFSQVLNFCKRSQFSSVWSLMIFRHRPFGAQCPVVANVLPGMFERQLQELCSPNDHDGPTCD